MVHFTFSPEHFSTTERSIVCTLTGGALPGPEASILSETGLKGSLEILDEAAGLTRSDAHNCDVESALNPTGPQWARDLLNKCDMLPLFRYHSIFD